MDALSGLVHLSLPVLAGMVSTTIFAASVLPMLVKAYVTKDLSSYSLGNMVLANTGNLVHCVYVYSLPAGPIWFLHAFYVVATGLMLLWYLRHHRCPRSPRRLVQAEVRLTPGDVTDEAVSAQVG